MCNLSEALVQEGIEQGIEKGIEKEVALCRKFSMTFEKTISQIKEDYNLSRKAAEEIVTKYWIN